MISIFSKLPYLLDDRRNPGQVYLQRVSSRTRAEEVAAFTGARLNPIEGYENDICIYIKPGNLEHVRDGAYVDPLDDKYTVESLTKRPGIKVLSMSSSHDEFLKSILKNEVIYIPHAHVNFERVKRTRSEVINCGYVGVNKAHHLRINRRVKEALATIGFNFTALFNFQTRDDIINFYKNLDIQVIGYFDFATDTPYYHQTKIVNAMSFGIPTIAGPKLGYRDVDDYYIKVQNMRELLQEVEKLKDLKMYAYWSEKGLQEAEKYHCSSIAKLYSQLT